LNLKSYEQILKMLIKNKNFNSYSLICNKCLKIIKTSSLYSKESIKKLKKKKSYCHSCIYKRLTKYNYQCQLKKWYNDFYY